MVASHFQRLFQFPVFKQKERALKHLWLNDVLLIEVRVTPKNFFPANGN
jgi:hypothetical protein